MRTTLDLSTVGQLIDGTHPNPAAVLGPHEVTAGGRPAVAVRAFLPDSTQAWVVDAAHQEVRRPMRRIHPAGLYEVLCPAMNEKTPRYLIETRDKAGKAAIHHDPYAFPPLLTDYDLHLLGRRHALAELRAARRPAAHGRRRRPA